MKQAVSILFIALLFFSCNSKDDKGRFFVTGEIKNVPDQKIFLEELYFSQKDPEVLDTADIKKGKFSISATSTEEGLYRLRLANNNTGFIFINDQNNISFTADINNLSLQNTSFNSPANGLLKRFINDIDVQRKTLETLDAQVEQLKNQSASDSLYKISSATFEQKNNAFKKYIIQYIDSVSDPVMALFALGYTRSIDPALLSKPVSKLTQRFPGNQAIASMVKQFEQMMVRFNATPHEGSYAPDINMPDTTGKPFALSMLRGKYVLVDFWASWCGPCRGENPNVVKAFNTFKDRNFTILGVSLDKNKEAWIKAINTDNLTWYHICDLKEWNTAAVSLYAFDAIPYNVLIDPKGKIIAQNLRGTDLEDKLMEVLK